MHVFYSKEINPSGKRSIVFSPADALEPDNPMDIPCGQCIGCRLKRSARWAARCVAECQMHSHSCFITLTYDDLHLPKDNSLRLDDFQKFMKRFRKAVAADDAVDFFNFSVPLVRFFHCGEYGEKFSRPHYHACVFGVSFKDSVLYRVHNSERYFISEKLSELWGKGFCVIGDVTFESAAYVARYITKKVTGERALDHYTKFNCITGEILVERKPEYCTMSRRPGIGYSWFQKYWKDCYPHDEFIIDGRNVTVPKYFDGLLDRIDSYLADDVKEKRIVRGKSVAWDNTYDRRITKEFCMLKKLDLLKRSYETFGSEIIR